MNTLTSNRDMYLRSYKAAISLSNTGVRLLERNRFYHAVLTLKDALDLMRASFPGTSPQLNVFQREAEIYRLLNQASLRIAQPISAIEKTQSIPDLPFRLQVITDDQSPETFAQVLHESVDCFAMRLDDSKTNWSNEASFELDSAVILMNYGTAMQCHAATSAVLASDASTKRFHSAYRFFHMALSVISRQHSSVLTNADDVEAVKVLLVSMLVVQNLFQLTAQMQMGDKAQEFYNKLCHLRGTFSKIGNVLSLTVGCNTVAAAA